MKKYIIICLVIICPQAIFAQIQMDVIKLSISKLKKENSYRIIDKKHDTLDIKIWRGSDRNLPLLEAEIRIKNTSDTIIVLHPNESKLFISYFWEGEQLQKSIYFYVKKNDSDTSRKNEIILQPDQDLYLLSSGYIADGTFLDLKFDKQKDNTVNVMKILPTLKYHYKDNETGLEITHKDVLDVQVRKLPVDSDYSIPEGYYLLDQEY